MQSIRCPVCNSEFDNKEVEKYKEYTLYWCTACDLQWWHPLENPGAGFYEETCCTLRDIFSFGDNLNWDHQQFFRYCAKSSGRLLDIGCGTGRFLYEVKRRRQLLHTTGLDFDRKAVEVAKSSLGLNNVYAMSLEEFRGKNSNGGFDIVTFFQVLEHQWDPAGFLKEIKKLLTPEGYIVLGIPNRNTWGGPLPWEHPPMHLTRWSATALRSFLERHGFSVVLLLESPASLVEARVLISSKMNFLLEDTVGESFRKIAKESENLDSNPGLKKVAGTTLNLLRLLRKGLLLTPALLLGAIGRASSKKGQDIFCIARNT